MFQMAHHWGVQPTEFWNMTVPEWFALFEIHQPKKPGTNMTQSQIDDMRDDLELTDEEWRAKYGATTA